MSVPVVQSVLSSTARAHPQLLVAGSYFIDGRKAVFEQYLDDGLLLFRDHQTQLPLRQDQADPRSALVDVAWFMDMISQERVKSPADLLERPRAGVVFIDKDDALAIDPGAAFRLRLLRAIDAGPLRPSNIEIQDLIDETYARFADEAQAYGKPPSVKTVRRWRTQRGTAGNRTFADCISYAGRVPRRSRLSDAALQLACEGAVTYWADKTIRQNGIRDHISLAVDKLNDARLSEPGSIPVKLPAQSTIQQFVKKFASFDTFQAKFGKARATKFFLAAGEAISAQRILQFAMADHTVIDAVVIDDVTGAVIGRPVLTVTLDVLSRSLLGKHISFDPPSVRSVISCLKDVLKPKTGCFGSDQYPVLQDIFGTPGTVYVDNGLDFIGVSLQDIFSDLGIALVATAVKSPTHKIYVERFFSTLNQTGIHLMPGTTLNAVQKTLRNNEFGSSPVMTLSELEQAIDRAIFSYHVAAHASLGERPPALVWQTLAARDGIPVFADPARLDALLAMSTTRVLARDGVELHGLQYNDPAQVNTMLYELFEGDNRKKTASIPVKVKFDPGNMGHIWVYQPKRHEYVELPCVDRAYADGLTRFQHVRIKAFARDQGLDFSSASDRRDARMELTAFIQSINAPTLQKHRKALARLKERPAVRQKLEKLGAYSHTGIELLSMEPMVESRSDLGALPHATARGAAKAKRTRALKSQARAVASDVRFREKVAGNGDNSSFSDNEDEWGSYDDE